MAFRSMPPPRRAWLAAGLVLAAHAIVAARVEVRIDFNKQFDFKSVKTWAWNPSSPGELKMARTQDDDPEAMRRQAEPIILDAVAMNFQQRGLTQAAAQPDVHVTYYVLLTNNLSGQVMGQFLPAVAGWGLPPFAQATQSLEMMNTGSLVLDLTAGNAVVWRGVAQAQLEMGTDPKKREAVLRESIRNLLRRFPPK